MGHKSHPRTRQIKGRLILGLLHGLALLPLPLARGLATALGWLAWLTPNPARRVTRINLDLCLSEWPERERRRLARRALIETLKSGTDMAHGWHRPERMLARIRGTEGEYEALRETLASGRPVLVLAPHLGFWEGVNFWFGRHHSMHALYMPSGLEPVDALIRNAREHFSSVLYPATPRGVTGLVRALRVGGRVSGILPDQVPARNAGRFAPFFGRPAATMTLASRLLHQTGARAFMVYARRLPGARGFTLVVRDPDPRLYDPDLDTSLRGLNTSIENLVMEAPEQYQWSYKRFRRRPEGGENPYR